MAKGKSLGEFAHTSTSATVHEGRAGSIVLQVNYEGTATGFGTVAITAEFVGRKSGTFSATGAAWLDNGDQLSGRTSGTFDSVGVNRWTTSSIWHISDGSALLSEGEIDLASRTWKGQNFEWN